MLPYDLYHLRIGLSGRPVGSAPARADAVVILNPTSGAGEGARVGPEIARELQRRGVEFRMVQTERARHALDLAHDAAAEGARWLIAAGGDGTIHDVANGILSAGKANETVLGVIPIGRGNDFVKVIPGTSPRSRAYDTIAARGDRPIDVGRVEWHGGGEYFLNAMGAGIDVEVVRQIERSGNLPAGLVYIAGLVRALARYDAIPLRLTLDGRRVERRVMLAAVANGCCVGGSFRLCPDARPDDGVLDVCIVREVGLARAAWLASRFLRGSHGGSPAVELVRARNVEIEVMDGAPLFLQLDGELREVPRTRPVNVTVQARALRVLAEPAPGAARALVEAPESAGRTEER